jgi:hypothetical protein
MASNGVQSYGYQAQLSASREGYCSDSGLVSCFSACLLSSCAFCAPFKISCKVQVRC